MNRPAKIDTLLRDPRNYKHLRSDKFLKTVPDLKRATMPLRNIVLACDPLPSTYHKTREDHRLAPVFFYHTENRRPLETEFLDPVILQRVDPSEINLDLSKGRDPEKINLETQGLELPEDIFKVIYNEQQLKRYCMGLIQTANRMQGDFSVYQKYASFCMSQILPVYIKQPKEQKTPSFFTPLYILA